MRILSVVTLVSPLGEYGGPLRVAVNQAQALIELGHDVTLSGSTRGFSPHAPRDLDGVPALLHPAVTMVPRVGFAGVGSPQLWRWMRREVTNYDVVHVHAARDLVTLPAARIAASRGVPYVLQTHGMIDGSRNPLSRPVDAVLTRPVLARARCAMYLTDLERDALVELSPQLPLVHVPNGVPLQSQGGHRGQPTVLYLARLAPRKRPGTLVEAARRLAGDHPEARFVMVGPDEGEGRAVTSAIERARAEGADIVWSGAIAPDQTADVMRNATIYVLPSVDEPYPMSVLEAMSIGLPVVVTDTCGLAGLIEQADAGVVVNDSVESLTTAIGHLLNNPERARNQGVNGRRFVREHLDMGSIARQLVTVYSD